MRVVIAEDLALLRDGLTRLLQAFDFEVVGSVDNGPALLPALMSHRPDVAVVDVRLPPTFTDEGLKALHNCKKLEHVDVRQTHVTSAGAQALHQALPRCTIVWDKGTITP